MIVVLFVLLSTKNAFSNCPVVVTYEWGSGVLLGPKNLQQQFCTRFRLIGNRYFTQGTYGLRSRWKRYENNVRRGNSYSDNVGNVDIWGTNDARKEGTNPNVILTWRVRLVACGDEVTPGSSTVSSLRDGYHTYRCPDNKLTELDNQLTLNVTFVR